MLRLSVDFPSVPDIHDEHYENIIEDLAEYSIVSRAISPKSCHGTGQLFTASARIFKVCDAVQVLNNLLENVLVQF